MPKKGNVNAVAVPVLTIPGSDGSVPPADLKSTGRKEEGGDKEPEVQPAASYRKANTKQTTPQQTRATKIKIHSVQDSRETKDKQQEQQATLLTKIKIQPVLDHRKPGGDCGSPRSEEGFRGPGLQSSFSARHLVPEDKTNTVLLENELAKPQLCGKAFGVSPRKSSLHESGSLNDVSTQPLPEALLSLEKLLEVIDNMLSFLEARGEPLIFHKVKESLSDMCGRKLDVVDLARLRTVYPEAYCFRPAYAYIRGSRVKSVIISIPRNLQSASLEPSSPKLLARYDLARGSPARSPLRQACKRIATELDKCPSDYFCEDAHPGRELPQTPLSSHKSPILVSPMMQSPQAYIDRVNIGLSLKQRKRTIRERLVKIMRDFKSQNDSSCEREYPDIPAHSMDELTVSSPPPPMGSPRPRTPVKRSAPVSPHTPTTPKLVPESCPSQLTPRTSKMKEILEKVRQREREAKSRSTACLLPEEIRYRAVLSRLPKLISALSFLFNSMNKNVLPITKIIERLSKSMPLSTTEKEAYEHIKVLTKIAPEWCKMVYTDTGAFLEIDNSLKIKDVRAEVITKVNKILSSNSDT